jgi:hypothetical protein
MNLKLTVGDKQILEKFGQNAAQNNPTSRIDGYRVSFFMDLDGTMKREYVTFNVKKEFFDSVAMGQVFEMVNHPTPTTHPTPEVLPKDEAKPTTNLFDTKPGDV